MKTMMDMSALNDFQSKGREGMEATMASFSAWASGWQAIAAECADYSKATMELSTKAVEEAVASKTIDAAYQSQADFAKMAYESLVGETSKLGEMYLATAREALAPLESQIRKAA